MVVTLPTLQEILNMYLYGSTTQNPEAPARPIGARETMDVDMTEYMQQAGWFAVPAQFNVVKDFFKAPVGTFTAGRSYSFAEVKAILETVNPGKTYTNLWDTKQYKWDHNTGGAKDLFERTMIYNSVQFKLGDATQFSVDGSGNLSLKNWGVIPDPDTKENFDFESTDPLAQFVNPAMQAILDHNGIGRIVDINFINDISANPTAYTRSDFNNDTNTNIPSWYIPTSSDKPLNDFLDAIKDLGDDYNWLLNNPSVVGDALKGLLPDWSVPAGGIFGDVPAIPILRGWGDPLVLDLDGDGVEVTKMGFGSDRSMVYFDMDNDGFAERTAWVTGGDGLLALDKNGNGKIDNQGELFGNTNTLADGFLNLKQYDSNADNKITSADAQFANLRVWVDADKDGQTDAGELKTLADLKITQINLGATILSNVSNNENTVAATSSFVMNGVTKTISEVWFRNDAMDTRYLGDVTLDVRTLFLPTLKGFGNLKDLHVAMSQDTALLTLVQNFTAGWSTKKFENPTALNNEVRAILYKWAGVDTIAAGSPHGGGDDKECEIWLQTYSNNNAEFGKSQAA